MLRSRQSECDVTYTFRDCLHSFQVALCRRHVHIILFQPAAVFAALSLSLSNLALPLPLSDMSSCFWFLQAELHARRGPTDRLGQVLVVHHCEGLCG